jgi:hypothetical protein
MLQERVMRTSIIPFISGQKVFDPDLAKALGDALRRSLRRTGTFRSKLIW